MFKHIKDGYYIVHNKQDFKEATEHFLADYYSYTKNPFTGHSYYCDNNTLFKYPYLMCFSISHKIDMDIFYPNEISLTDLKAVLGDENV